MAKYEDLPQKPILTYKVLSPDERKKLLEEYEEKAERDELMRYNDAINKGRQEGKLEVKREDALMALSEGLDVGLVSRITGLSIDEVEKLAEQK